MRAGEVIREVARREPEGVVKGKAHYPIISRFLLDAYVDRDELCSSAPASKMSGMARMIPDEPVETESKAEQRLFERLRAETPDEIAGTFEQFLSGAPGCSDKSERVPLPAAPLLVFRARRLHLRDVRDLGDGNIPPRLVARHSGVAIDLDADDNRTSGHSYASAWTSCDSARVTAPVSAGDVRTRIAASTAGTSCSGRQIRSK
jgi:hypothetical protein